MFLYYGHNLRTGIAKQSSSIIIIKYANALLWFRLSFKPIMNIQFLLNPCTDSTLLNPFNPGTAANVINRFRIERVKSPCLCFG